MDQNLNQLNQCRKCADVLLDNFRNDVGCEVLTRFRTYGVSLHDLLKLADKIPIVYPWTTNYDRLRYNVNRRFIAFPLAIAMCENETHVQKIFKWARKRNIDVTIRSGSHCFEDYSISDWIIIDQSQMKKIKINSDLKKSQITIQSGVLQGPLALALSEHHLAFAGGTCPNVAASGLSLGGGIGFLTRKYGLASDNLLDAKVLLADGSFVNANKKENKDLYWALRGAGNQNYGIVVEFTFRVHPVSNVIVFNLIYSFDSIYDVIHAWQDWAPFVTNNLTSELDVFHDRILVTGLYLPSKKQKDPIKYVKKLLGEAFGHIKVNERSIEEMPYIDAAREFAGEGRWQPFFDNKSGFVKEPLPDDAIEIIERFMSDENVGGVIGNNKEDHVELDAFGGKVSQISSDATAFVHRDVLYWCHLQTHWLNEEENVERIAWITEFYDELKNYLIGAYINAPDADLPDALEEYYGDNLRRLRQIKSQYDPKNIFHYHQSIPPFDDSKS